MRVPKSYAPDYLGRTDAWAPSPTQCWPLSPSLLFVRHLNGGRRRSIRTNIRRAGLRPRGHDIPRLQEHVPAALGVARRRRRCQQQSRRGAALRRRRVSSPSRSSSSAIELDLACPGWQFNGIKKWPKNGPCRSQIEMDTCKNCLKN